MKLHKIFLTTLLLSTASIGQSQILISIIFGDKLNSENLEFGLQGGIAFSQFRGLESKNYAGNFNLGFYFDFQIKESPWWFNTGVLVKSDNGSGKLSKNDVYKLYPELGTYADSGTYSQSIGQFNVPLFLKYRFKNHMYAEFGGQASLLWSAHLSYEHAFDNVTLNTTVDNKDRFNRIDFGLVAGVGYKLRDGKGMNIAVKYYYGLVDMMKSDPTLYNSVIYTHVDIPIGKSKDL
jgi:hypothetical protein